MLDGFKDRYDDLMVGKNGGDAISRTCIIAAIVLVVLSFFCVGVNPFLYVLVLVVGIALAAYAALRMNSRDIAARADENRAFLEFFQNIGRRQAKEPAAGRTGSRRTQQQRQTRGAQASASRRPRRTEREDAGQRGQARAEEQPQEQARPQREPQEQAGAKQEAQPEKVTVACDSCGQKLRVPAGKGTVKVRCPKCQNVFTLTT